MRLIKKIVFSIIVTYIVYILIFGIFIFKFQTFKVSDLFYDTNEMKTVSSDNVNAKILDNHIDSLHSRIKIINKAEEIINITTLSFKSDITGSILYGTLLNKANEGVIINIVANSTNMKTDKWFKAVSSHENINFYFFEPFDLFAPKAVNNVLHDKILAVDNKYAIIGGRNSHDKYLLENNPKGANDRDVLLFNFNNDLKVVSDMNDYVNDLINYQHTKLKTYKNTSKRINLQNELINKYQTYLQTIDLSNVFANSIVVDNATYVRSPLNRGYKDPVLYKVINDLSVNANEVIFQSPYITTSKLMEKTFPLHENTNYTFITNNISSNPNLMASSNYYKIRGKIANVATLYEIQTERSLHAKTVVIDNNISIIGSQNLDSRSMFLSAESMVVIYSEEFNEQLRISINNYIDNSLQVKGDGSYELNSSVEPRKVNKFKVFIIKLISLISNLFKEFLTVVKK